MPIQQVFCQFPAKESLQHFAGRAVARSSRLEKKKPRRLGSRAAQGEPVMVIGIDGGFFLPTKCRSIHSFEDASKMRRCFHCTHVPWFSWVPHRLSGPKGRDETIPRPFLPKKGDRCRPEGWRFWSDINTYIYKEHKQKSKKTIENPTWWNLWTLGGVPIAFFLPGLSKQVRARQYSAEVHGGGGMGSGDAMEMQSR